MCFYWAALQLLWRRGVFTRREVLDKQERFEQNLLEKLQARASQHGEHSGAFGTVNIIQPKFFEKSEEKSRKELRRPIAIKHQVFQKEIDNKKYFKNEVEAHKKSTAPIKLHNHTHTEQHGYTVMDAMEVSLHDLLTKKNMTIDQSIRKTIARGILDQIASLQEEDGYIHQDIKPHNIMINPYSGEVSIIDYGLAQKEDELKAGGGTLGFLAPEAVSNRSGDKTLDSWSVGCVLARIHCGRIINDKLNFAYYKGESRGRYDNRIQTQYKSAIKDIKSTVKNPEEMNFILELLEFDQATRITPAHALQHPFLKQPTSYSELAYEHRKQMENKASLEKKISTKQGNHSEKSRISDKANQKNQAILDEKNNQPEHPLKSIKRKAPLTPDEKKLLKVEKSIKELQDAMQWHDLQSQINSLYKGRTWRNEVVI